MIDKSKPLFSLTVGEFLELQQSQSGNQAEKRSEVFYLTVDETCKYLNIARPTLYAYTSKRLIPFIKRGRKLLFLKSDIEKLLLSARKETIEELYKSCQ